ncbi:hypothetical protein [Aquimarina sp. 2201CG5-10]|uniref:hypothetical protein n=1 Tax=Aquimarina callyspongiae TaxID=3098150 RepID=UPI002AB4C121|nr:hypothetical protein [Aquimarina sp. 2201CG5-10]MDY8134203.1 hypothetical protein [Aquimarina sp. 2201CG5-10]
MFKKLLDLGAYQITRKEQKSINAGGSRGPCYPFFHLGPCRLNCNCQTHTARQPSGASQQCLLNYPAIIFNAAQCGGSGNGGGGWA